MLFDDHGKPEEGKGYQSFLLRLWQVDVEGVRAWRFSLEKPMSGERRGFSNLGELMSYLIQIICGEDRDNDV